MPGRYTRGRGWLRSTISWRDYDPEDTVRFYALRLRELGMIKSSPDKIIAEGTDWRFIKEVRKEVGI
jgi:NitT/TauT family transport system substrate-binding protein